jgi:hypothetical protein
VLDLMAQHPAWSLPLGCKDGVFELAGVPSGAHLRDREMFRFIVDGSRDFDDLQFQEPVGHGRRWRARTLMLALCRLERAPVSGTNGRLPPRFGTEGSEVQILSPRPIKTAENPMRTPSNLEGLFHLCIHRRGRSGDTGTSVASCMFSCHFGYHQQL